MAGVPADPRRPILPTNQAYILVWAWRLKPKREELSLYAQELHEMQFHGQKVQPDRSDPVVLHGIIYLDDLRGHGEREGEKEGP